MVNHLQLCSIGAQCTCSGWSRLSAIFGNCFHYTTKNGTMRNTTIILISVYELISMCRCYNGGYTHSYSYTCTGLQPIRDTSWKDTPPNHHRRFHIHTKSPSFCRIKDLKNLDPTMQPCIHERSLFFCKSPIMIKRTVHSSLQQVYPLQTLVLTGSHIR